MIKVDEVYPIDINSTIGPTGTIKRLFKNRDYFTERGYDLHIFANYPVKKKFLTYDYELHEVTTLPGQPQSGLLADTINSKGWKSRLKSRLKTLIECSQFTSALMVNKREKDNMYAIEYYLSLNRNPEIIVFHEVNSCYHYYKLTECHSHAKTAMFIHADGTDDAMFTKTHPKLIGSSVNYRVNEHLNYALNKCDRVIFISELARQRFCKNHPEFASKAITVVNGIDDISLLDVPATSSSKYRLVCTGSVCNRKGQYIVIEAMNRMSRDILKDTHFTIIGTGPDHERLVALVEKYSLKDHVSFAGNIPNTKVHKMLCGESIYILMSNNEGLPISILEAMRARLPVISTKVAGIPEEVDKRNGILLEPNVEQLTEVLNSLPEYDWNVMGAFSRKRFEEEFTFDIMRKHYADMLDSLNK